VTFPLSFKFDHEGVDERVKRVIKALALALALALAQALHQMRFKSLLYVQQHVPRGVQIGSLEVNVGIGK